MSYDEPSFRAELADVFSFTFAPANVSAWAARNLSSISTSFSRIQNPLAHPVRDRPIHLIQLPHKKMVCSFHHHHSILSGQRCKDTPQFSGIPKLVVPTVHKELRFRALRQIGK